MSTYNPYQPPYPRPRRTPFWPLVLLLVLAGVLGIVVLDRGLGWHLWPHQNPPFAENAVPRPIDARGELGADERATIALYRQTAPSVVHISNVAVRRNSFTMNVEQELQGTGSGFIWDDKGIVVTNAHVVKGAGRLQVILADKERTTLETKYWVSYPDKDLAVLYVEPSKVQLHKIPLLGTSSDLQVGQKTYAIGNPFGLDQTLTTGIVSALDREIKSASGRPIQGVIQTSAAINPGNSGGPLLDSAGRLIGVNTAIYSPTGTFAGIGFSIPVDEVNRVVPSLIAKLNEGVQHDRRPTEVVPPKLGVQFLPDALARRMGVTKGVMIFKVIPGGPAAKAGLRGVETDEFTGRDQLGDIILALDGTPVQSMRDVLSFLDNHQPGDAVTVRILRNGQEQDVPLTLEAMR